MRIGVTGTPGTGKTTISKLLSRELGYEYVDVKGIVKYYGLGREIDIRKLERLLKKILRDRDNYVIESHLLVEMNIDLDIMIVLRASYRALLRRYRTRHYSEEIIWENIAAELQDYFVSKLQNRKYIEVDTTGKKPNEVVRRIIEYIQLGKGEDVDWNEDLLSLILRGRI